MRRDELTEHRERWHARLLVLLPRAGPHIKPWCAWRRLEQSKARVRLCFPAVQGGSEDLRGRPTVEPGVCMEHRKGCLPQDLLRLRQRVPPRCIGCAPTPVLKPDKKPDPEQGHALAAAKAAAATAAAAKAGGCYRQQRAERQQCRRRRHVRTAEHLPRTSSARAPAALPRLRRALALHSDAWRMRAHRCQQCCTWRCRTSLDPPHAAAR